VALTFDDGFRACYDLVAPILTEEKLSATFFVNNNTIDNRQFMWRTALLFIQNNVPSEQINRALSQRTDKKVDLWQWSNQWSVQEKEQQTSELWNRCDLPLMESVLKEEKPYLTSQQIQALNQSGFEIGGHTFSHPFCNRIAIDELEKEIIKANADLEKSLDVPIQHFSYPFGNRPSANIEKQLFKGTNLQTVLGIDYKKHNRTNPLQWNRIKMENTLFKTKFMMGVHRFLGR